VLPTKKFPELKLVINGEQRTSNTLSSDEELQLNVSSQRSILYKVVVKLTRFFL
jgi:hypothetical protein